MASGLRRRSMDGCFQPRHTHRDDGFLKRGANVDAQAGLFLLSRANRPDRGRNVRQQLNRGRIIPLVEKRTKLQTRLTAPNGEKEVGTPLSVSDPGSYPVRL